MQMDARMQNYTGGPRFMTIMEPRISIVSHGHKSRHPHDQTQFYHFICGGH